MDEFSKLARYAPDDVATDATKKEKFLEGLNDELSMQLMVANFNNYQELVDRALMLEGKRLQNYTFLVHTSSCGCQSVAASLQA